MASIRKREWTTAQGKTRQAWVLDYFAWDPQKGKRCRVLKTFKRKSDAEEWQATALHEVKQGTASRNLSQRR